MIRHFFKTNQYTNKLIICWQQWEKRNEFSTAGQEVKQEKKEENVIMQKEIPIISTKNYECTICISWHAKLFFSQNHQNGKSDALKSNIIF